VLAYDFPLFRNLAAAKVELLLQVRDHPILLNG
jgi:hypothetical protein